MKAITPCGLTSRAAPADDRFGGVDAVHPRDVAKANQEAHPRPVRAAEVHARRAGGDVRSLGQVHRRDEPADVDLLAHHQLPEVSLGAAVDRLDFAQADAGSAFHGPVPVLKRSRNVPPTTATHVTRSGGHVQRLIPSHGAK